MRIEFVTDTFPPDINGVAMTLGRLTKCLKEQGHYVHITHTGEETSMGETSKRSLRLPGYKEVRVGLPSPIKLRKRWKNKRPDAIYVATESPLGISAMKAARELSIPVIAGFHTNFPLYLRKYKLTKAERPAMAYLKKIHNKCDSTMVPSEHVRKMLDNEGFENLRILGRGVDTELFHPSKRSASLRSEWGARSKTPVVIIVGRVSGEKNLDFALDTTAQLQTQIPDLKAVVVGDGPARARLEAKFPQVIFAGMQTGEDLAEHYASADMMLFASETETFGNVLLEAMASGLVTVSYDYAASNIHIKDAKNGFKAELANEQEFVTSAKQALSNIANADIKQSAFMTAHSLSWSNIAHKFITHLEEIIATQPATKRRIKDKQTLKVRSLFLSDIHLGTEDSKAREVTEILRNIDCDKIYLNGDIIDGWALKRGGKWKKSHTKVIRTLLKKSESGDCEIIYTRGNHDDFLTQFLPIAFGDINFSKEHCHETIDGKRYLVIHGDGFDSVCTNHKWLASVGAVGYDFLLTVNRFYNKYRVWRGKEYFSISKAIKSKVKSAVSFVDNYEDKLHDLATSRGYDGIICGHIHTPADKMIKDIHYLNSGDWVETMSCIVENLDGTFELLYYQDLLERFEKPSVNTIKSITEEQIRQPEPITTPPRRTELTAPAGLS